MEVNIFDVIKNIADNKFILKLEMTVNLESYYILSQNNGSTQETQNANLIFWSLFFYRAIVNLAQKRYSIYLADINRAKTFLVSKLAKDFSVKIDPINGNVLTIPLQLNFLVPYIKVTNQVNSGQNTDNIVGSFKSDNSYNQYFYVFILYTIGLVFYVFWIYHTFFVATGATSDTTTRAKQRSEFT